MVRCVLTSDLHKHTALFVPALVLYVAEVLPTVCHSDVVQFQRHIALFESPNQRGPAAVLGVSSHLFVHLRLLVKQNWGAIFFRAIPAHLAWVKSRSDRTGQSESVAR